MKYLKIVLAAFASEILAIISLVIVVAIFGPQNQDSAKAFAEDIGFWVGPIAGFLFTLVAAWFIARNLESGQIRNGIAVGVATAAIDVLLLVLGGSVFQFVFVLSNLGRVIAGYVGGWLASRSNTEVL